MLPRRLHARSTWIGERWSHYALCSIRRRFPLVEVLSPQYPRTGPRSEIRTGRSNSSRESPQSLAELGAGFRQSFQSRSGEDSPSSHPTAEQPSMSPPARPPPPTLQKMAWGLTPSVSWRCISCIMLAWPSHTMGSSYAGIITLSACHR